MARVVWINGAFGVGKTTTADLLATRAGWRKCDPEFVGYVLAEHLRDRGVDDFQDLAAWRRLVPPFLAEIASESGDDLIAVQTVLNADYWRQLDDGLREQGLDVCHVFLDADPVTLRSRIDGDDPEPRAWRHDHVDRFVQARDWMTEAAELVVDTATLAPDGVVDAIVVHLESVT